MAAGLPSGSLPQIAANLTLKQTGKESVLTFKHFPSFQPTCAHHMVHCHAMTSWKEGYCYWPATGGVNSSFKKIERPFHTSQAYKGSNYVHDQHGSFSPISAFPHRPLSTHSGSRRFTKGEIHRTDVGAAKRSVNGAQR